MLVHCQAFRRTMRHTSSSGVRTCNTHAHTRFRPQGNAKLPGIMAVGYIAAFSETLALAVIVSKGVAPLKDVSHGVIAPRMSLSTSLSFVASFVFFFLYGIYGGAYCLPERDPEQSPFCGAQA